MAEFADREHYIPLRKADLIQLLARDPQLTVQERQPFQAFCRLITAIYHVQYLEELEKLKDAYAPFDPDSETRPLKPLDAEQKQKCVDQLFSHFESLMNRGNFQHLSWTDVEAAMEGGSTAWGVNMNVDPTVFERIELFARGDTMVTRTKGWFRKKQIKVACWQRLVFIIKMRPHRRLRKTIDTKSIYVKIFKDIPKLDLEMLLPGGRLEWPALKKWTFWGALSANLGYLAFSVGPKLVAVGLAIAGGLELLQRDFTEAYSYFTKAVVLGPIAILAGFSYRQYSSYQTTKQNYTLMLTESLYYQNLDNNFGVLTRLLDEAEEQECREVLLGYYCLWKYAPPAGWEAGQLDDYVEMFLEEKANLKVDFEIGDALDKLEKLGLVTKTGSHYHGLPLTQALPILESRWNQLLRS